ncbi:uncharacterized protein LOC116932820 [Daphnia magna]|uniref:uncharacterized protein LOC116932820 n=1 Tax=Daphnia magna TaxID=35525 RepID=UPI001E1BA30D|nr:uncharacterized protein LOC116932820 [Daphnia magna]XP_045036521.1 uncharacterized protein LOC116932820 [Daphnia magna]XP_045036522.1 uncharacterized protein LOC116932820 [Daphnia magna]
MAKLWWCVVLIVVSIAILAESSSTTKRPKSRKAPLNRNLAQQPSSSRRVASSSLARKAPSSQRSMPSLRAPTANATSAVRRNPASLQASQDLGFQASPVDRSRLKEDMAALGLSLNPEDNSINVMGPSDAGRKPPQRPPALVQRPNQPLPNSYNDYEDLLFDDYDQPLQDNKLLAESSSSGKFLKSEVCGRKFVCQRGNRGPCHRNEVFIPQLNDSSLVITRPSCGNLVSYPWNGCMSAGKVGVAATNSVVGGGCAVRFPQRPCYGYPPNYRFYGESKRCYPVSMGWETGMTNSGPCSLNKLYTDIDGINGMCQCRDRNQLLFKGDDRCHRIYAKGPCDDGQWLEPDTNGYGTCRPSPCPESKCDGRHIYWKSTPNSEGGCYKSFTRGPCRRGSYFLVEDYGTRRGRCVSQFGSSFNPMNPYVLPPRYPVMRNPYDMMYANNAMSPWSKFGMYPPFGMQEEYGGDDYDDIPSFDY